MSLTENKQLASDFFARFSANDIAGALEMLTADASWWIAGKPDQLPAAGAHNKEQIARVLYGMAGRLKDGLRMTVKSLIAEDDRVAAEVESYGELLSGQVYNNEYHFLLTIRAGRITEVKEYLDTQHIFVTWFRT